MGPVWDYMISRKRTGRKQLAILIDPDKFEPSDELLIALSRVDAIFVGSSLLKEKNTHSTCTLLKKSIDVPIILFPGNSYQITNQADAILFMSLISGRNPEFLISQQVQGAPLVKKSGLETIPTGYMLVESGNITAAAYVSQTVPIPHDKPEIAGATAMAGEMLGMKAIYMDGGSGAEQRISMEMIAEVKQTTNAFIIIGGGMTTPDHMLDAWNAGADMVVIGTAVEQNPNLLVEFLLRRTDKS